MKLRELFKNITTDVIAVVNLRNTEAGTTYADEERTPCVSLDFPQHDNEFNDSYLMCVGDYINEFLNDEWHSDEEDIPSIDLDQSLFAHVSHPRDWDKYVDKSSKAFGITFRDKYTYIVPIKENWEAI